jgi:hypothetical protein
MEISQKEMQDINQ